MELRRAPERRSVPDDEGSPGEQNRRQRQLYSPELQERIAAKVQHGEIGSTDAQVENALNFYFDLTGLMPILRAG